MANVVVIGAGLGGLPTAYELRHLLLDKFLAFRNQRFQLSQKLLQSLLFVRIVPELQLLQFCISCVYATFER